MVGESVIHTSEYVYLKSGSNSLCHTTNFQWKRDVYVYIVVSVKKNKSSMKTLMINPKIIDKNWYCLVSVLVKVWLVPENSE